MRKRDLSAAEIGVFSANNNIAATDEVLAGMGQLFEEAFRRKDSTPEISQGFLFEIIEATRFNHAHAEAGSPIRAVLTSAIGKPHDVADILILDGNKVLEKVQAKSSSSGLNCIKEIWKKYDKYQSQDGMTILVPNDKVDRTLELAQKRADSGSIYSEKYSEISGKTYGRLEKNGIGSKGTTYEEALSATKNPEAFVASEELKAVAKEGLASAKNAAIAGGIISGIISAVKHSVAVHKGQMSGKEALKSVGEDAGKGVARSGITGALSTGVRYGGAKSGAAILKKANVATAIAALLVDTGVVTYGWARGEITDGEAIERLGVGGTSTISSIFAGASAGMAFGPVGALVGSIGGYIVSSQLYNSCKAIAKSAELSMMQAKKLEALVDELEKKLRDECEAFERALDAAIKEKAIAFDRAVIDMNRSLIQEEPLLAVSYLTDLSYDLGCKLRFENFDEFDEAMNDDAPLLL